MDSPASRDAVGVVGLGLLGTAWAERLLAQGFPVVVWNRTRAKADPLLARGAVWSDNPLRTCRRVILSLYTTEVVGQVLAQLSDGLRRGLVLIDTTTGEAARTASLAADLARQGVRYLDAPVSGSSDQARRGEAMFMVGGDADTFQDCHDLWTALGGQAHHLGSSGSGARMKLITNLVLGLNRAALAEGLAFAEALEVPPATALAVLARSNAYSRAMDVKGRRMVERDFRPDARLSQHLKDVRLMQDAAADAGLVLPLTATHRRLLEQAEALGLGDSDNSAILEVLRAKRPPTPPDP